MFFVFKNYCPIHYGIRIVNLRKKERWNWFDILQNKKPRLEIDEVCKIIANGILSK